MKENVSHKVLVIEDHPEMQAILKRFLAERAYEVITADNAEVGLEIYNKIQPDIILMDIMLPGMSGLEATKLIRKKHGENRYTPIIMLTAKNKTDEIVEGLEIGADDYVVKPFNFEELYARMNSALRIKRLNELLLKQSRDLESANFKIITLNENLVEKNKELRKNLFSLHNLFEISLELNSILELNRLVNSTLLTMVGQFSSKSALFFLVSRHSKDILEVLNHKGYHQRDINDMYIDKSDPLVSYFKLHPLPSPLKDLAKRVQKSAAIKKLNELDIEILAPITIQDFIEGFICLGPRVKSQEYSKREFEHISILSNIISIAVSNASLYEEIEQLSYTDGMTDLHNYRYFELRLKEEVMRHRRTKNPLSLLILDVDHFKNFNDTMGHPEGDQVLRKVANILKETVRENDIVARYGGEEFAVILPSVEHEGAAILAERIRKKIEETYFEHEEVQPINKVTVSVGGAVAPDNAENFKELIHKADSALYAAKRSGRNQIRMYKTEMI
jgi:diguanylate cyclase (GGDEF)-like protein